MTETTTNMTHLNSDIVLLKESLQKLTKDFEGQTEMAKKFQETYFKLQQMIQELEEQFKQMTQPLMKVVIQEKTKDEPQPSPEDLITRTVSINNLNEFICEKVLSEYLRQNNVSAVRCTESLGYNERSRNFHVTVRQPDMQRLLDPDMWPKGVTLSVKGQSLAGYIQGKREKDLPGVIISPGMSYWHS